jgi:hypothetical protein
MTCAPALLDFDDHLAWFRFGVWSLLDHQLFKTTEALSDDGTHENILQMVFATRERGRRMKRIA